MFARSEGFFFALPLSFVDFPAEKKTFQLSYQRWYTADKIHGKTLQALPILLLIFFVLSLSRKLAGGKNDFGENS